MHHHDVNSSIAFPWKINFNTHKHTHEHKHKNTKTQNKQIVFLRKLFHMFISTIIMMLQLYQQITGNLFFGLWNRPFGNEFSFIFFSLILKIYFDTNGSNRNVPIIFIIFFFAIILTIFFLNCKCFFYQLHNFVINLIEFIRI